jgi:hypothetical protein
MKLGTETNSPEQLNLLERARRGPTELLAQGLYRVSKDEDIRAELEELHPEWLTLYESKRETFGRYLRWTPSFGQNFACP